MDARLTSYGGIPCLCNLQWELKSDNIASHLTGKSQLELTWGNRTASIKGRDGFVGLPPLLALVVSELDQEEQDGSVLIAFEDKSNAIWLTATLEKGRPALEPEHLFETRSDLLQYIAELPKSSHKRILYSDGLTNDINTFTPIAVLRDPKLDPREFAGFKPRKPLFSKTTKRILGGLAVVVALSASGQFGWKWYSYVPAAAKLQTVIYPYVEDVEAFAKGCEAAFSQSWPTVPGWSLVNEGCATQLMDDPQLRGILKEPAAAFKVFTLNPKHNEILSARAAELVYADWPHKTQVSDKTLLVFIPFDVGLKPYTQVKDQTSSEAAPSIKYRIENTFLGIEDGIRQGDINGVSTVTVTTSAALGEVLRRVSSLKTASIKSLSRVKRHIKLTFKELEIIHRVAPHSEEETPA